MVQALLARMAMSMVRNIILGSSFDLHNSKGWGDTGVQETSTDRLQEAVIPIVHSGNCTDRMSKTEGFDEN